MRRKGSKWGRGWYQKMRCKKTGWKEISVEDDLKAGFGSIQIFGTYMVEIANKLKKKNDSETREFRKGY